MFSFGFLSTFVFLCLFTACQGSVRTTGENCPNLIAGKDHSISIGTFSYAPNLNCTYDVKFPAGNRVTLKFSEFYIAGTMPDCEGDHMEIKVGCTNPMSVGKYCSLLMNMSSFHSPDGCVTVVFKSVGKKGCASLVGSCSLSNGSVELSPSCSTNSSRELISPHWPMNYKPGDKCTWVLDVKGIDGIQIFFTSFKVEQRAECLGDYLLEDEVNIYGVKGQAKKHIVRFCLFDKPAYDLTNVTEYDKIEVVFFGDNDKNTASGIAGGLIAYKKVQPVGYVQLYDQRCASTAMTTTPPVQGSLLTMTILGFIVSKYCCH